jgi:hypothetical protein
MYRTLGQVATFNGVRVPELTDKTETLTVKLFFKNAIRRIC